MLFVCTGLWWVALYGLRIAFFGNPVHMFLKQTDPDFLTAMEEGAERHSRPIEHEEEFHRRFGRMILVQMLALILEVVLLVHLWYRETAQFLCLVLLTKNLVCGVIGVVQASSLPTGKTGPYRTLLALPEWVTRLDRVSAFTSGTGALALIYLCLSKAEVL